MQKKYIFVKIYRSWKLKLLKLKAIDLQVNISTNGKIFVIKS